MLDRVQLVAYAAVAVFNLGATVSWVRLLVTEDKSRVLYPILAASAAILVASVAVAITHAVLVFDREHVILAGRIARPTVAAGLFAAGLTQFWWRRTR